jgi:hypothetical protein
MPRIIIQTILGGHSVTTGFAQATQLRASLGIDPAQPIDDLDTKFSTIASGVLRPAASQKFSGSTITSAPLWIVPNPKTSNVYVYDAKSSAYTIDATMTTVTALSDAGALSGLGNGCEYYDNYMYFATGTDIARLGPLNGSAAFVPSYWTGTLSKTALTDTVYPTTFKNNLRLPNHVLKRLSNGYLYIADVVGNQGTLHYIRTSKSSVEGDTNNGSTYSALTLGYGLWPTALEAANGTEIAIALYEGSVANLRQARAKVAFWNTTSTNANKIIWCEFPDQIITAMRNVNGILYAFSGNVNAQGWRLSRHTGSYTFQEVYYSETGEPPLPGAVDGILNRVLAGTFTTVPESDGVVTAYGLQKSALGSGVFNVMRATGGTASTSVTCLAVVDNNEMGFSSPIIGWTQAGEGSTGASHGFDKQGTQYNNAPAVAWSQVFRIGQKFQITKIRIPFAQAVAANMIVTPTIYVDDGITSYVGGVDAGLAIINNTNYPNSERKVLMSPQSLTGENNFWLELRWTGSALLSINLPIIIEYELIEDGNS